MLEAWMRSYRPEELFDEDGRPLQAILDQAPEGPLRMGATPHANGGELLRDAATCRTSATTPSTCPSPAPTSSEATRVLGGFLRDVMRGEPARRSALFGPDETASNRLGAVFEVTDRDVGRRAACPATTTSRPTAA